MKQFLLCALIAGLSHAAFPQNMILPLWEGQPPNFRENNQQTFYDTTDIVRVSDVRYPDLAVFLPSKKNATGEAVVKKPCQKSVIRSLSGAFPWIIERK